MALLYPGNDEWEQSGPEVWIPTPFELDQLVVPFEGPLTTLQAFVNALVVGQDSDIDTAMKLQRWTPSKARPGIAQVELLYLGPKGGVLPAKKHNDDDTVQSASSKMASSGLVLPEAVTIQYYAPTSVLSYMDNQAAGISIADDPQGNPRVNTMTSGDATFFVTGVVQDWVDLLFVPQIIKTMQNEEVLPGKFWMHVSRKTKIYSPFIFTFPSGPQILLYNPGNGYQVGDNLSISADGETATMEVTSAGAIWDGTGIIAWDVLTNTFTQNHDALPAFGGSGSGAGFNVRMFT